jgi:hypothetical protein
MVALFRTLVTKIVYIRIDALGWRTDWSGAGSIVSRGKVAGVSGLGSEGKRIGPTPGRSGPASCGFNLRVFCRIQRSAFVPTS